MKVLIVTPTYLPATRYGGTIYSVHGLVKGLLANGVDVDVVTTSVDGLADSVVDHEQWAVVDGVRVWYCHSHGPLRRIYYSAAMKSFLDARANAYDIIHAHAAFLWPNSYAYRAARRANIPFVWSPRGMLVKRLFSSKSAWFKWPWWWLHGRHLVAGARLLHCTSQDERHEIAAFGVNARYLVLANGVEIPADPALERDTKRIVYVGRISWKKRIDTLIDALAPFLQSGYVLDVIGNDEEGLSAALKRRAHNLGVGEAVRFTGSLSPQQRDAVLWGSGVLCLVSEQENFGNVVLEAMACATPVVVSAGCGVSEVVKAEQSGVVCAADVESIRAALHRIVDDPIAARHMGARGRSAVIENYSWKRIGALMRDEYARVLE